jgi:hypothetical protein
MHKMNGQSFTAQKLGLKSSQGSETLFFTGVKYLLVQGIGMAGWVLAHLRVGRECLSLGTGDWMAAETSL